jgi:hypothetical protein
MPRHQVYTNRALGDVQDDKLIDTLRDQVLN